MPRDDGSTQRIYRCPDCQVASTASTAGPRPVRPRRDARRSEGDHAGRAHLHAVEVGWVTLPDGGAAFDDYYDSKQLWPAESLARLRAAFLTVAVTMEEVCEFAATLPRAYEAFVRGRVKFRVGRIVFLAFSKDGR